MYKNVFAFICLIASLLIVSSSDAQMRRSDLTIFSPMSVSQGPRAVGMGNAYIAVADDVNSVWLNPAGTTGVENIQLSLSHSRWFVNSVFNTGAIAYSNGEHTLGVGLMTFKPQDVEETTILQPNGTGRILDLNTLSASLFYAYKFTDKLSFGVRFVYVRENLDLSEQSTFNVDFGTKFYTGIGSLRLSMAMRNFGKDAEIAETQYQQPLSFNLGMAAEIFGNVGDPFYITGSTEMIFVVNWYERYHLGGEAWLNNMLALRAGYMFRYDSFGLTAGFGVKIPFLGNNVTADMSWQQSKHGLENPLRFGIGFDF